MKRNIIYSIFFCLTAFLLFSCKKENYLVGGALNVAKVNETTYDYLANDPHHLFDTLILLIDDAGLKDSINQPGITFFAPTDYSIDNYLTYRTIKAQNVNPFAQYTIDSLIKYDLQTFKDSIGAYIVHTALNFNDLTPTGTEFLTGMDTTYSVVSYEPTHDHYLGFYGAVNTPPSIVYYTLLNQKITGQFNAQNFTKTDGYKARVQTFGILTTTGTLGVLGNENSLYFGQ
ncbi:MAG: hypothetical protein ACRDE2_04185 [Chitinophagaceae bacterium]